MYLRGNENSYETLEKNLYFLKEKNKLFNYQLNQLFSDFDLLSKADVSFIESTNDTNSVNPYNKIENDNFMSFESLAHDINHNDYTEDYSFYLTTTSKKNVIRDLNRDNLNCTCMWL